MQTETEEQYQIRFRKECPFKCRSNHMDCTRRFSTDEERIIHEKRFHKQEYHDDISIDFNADSISIESERDNYNSTRYDD